MTIAVITGGRDRTPTLAELEQLAEVLEHHAVRLLRHGDCRGTDRSVAAWLKARELVEVEPWPADWDRLGPAAGPKRNRAMLDGGGQGDLFGAPARPRADLLIAFAGGDGTADCRCAAQHRGIEVVDIEPALEPRPWNRHHGEPSGPSIYAGRGTPLGNPHLDLDDYRAYLWRKIRPGPKRDPDVIEAFEQLTPDHYVVCSCWPRHCHTEVVIRAWRWMTKRAASSPL